MAADGDCRMRVPKCENLMPRLLVVDKGALDQSNIGRDNRMDFVGVRPVSQESDIHPVGRKAIRVLRDIGDIHSYDHS